MIGAIKTVYSYYAKDTDPQLLANTWEMVLASYNDREIETAFEKCLKRCKTPPTPADIVEEIEKGERVLEGDIAEYWEEYINALQRGSTLAYYFPFTMKEANGKTQGENARAELAELYKGLSYPVKRYIGSVGMFAQKSRQFNYDDLRFEKAGFSKEIVTYRKHETLQIEDKSFIAFLEEGA